MTTMDRGKVMIHPGVMIRRAGVMTSRPAAMTNHGGVTTSPLARKPRNRRTKKAKPNRRSNPNPDVHALKVVSMLENGKDRSRANVGEDRFTSALCRRYGYSVRR